MPATSLCRVRKKGAKGRNNSSVLKINSTWDAGRVMISRGTDSKSHHRRQLTLLGSH